MFSPPGQGAQQYQAPQGPPSAMFSQLQGRRMPQEQAWDAAPYNVYSDGPGGSSTTLAGDSLSGQFNPGFQDQGQGGDPRATLIQQIVQSLSQASQGNRTSRPGMGQPWSQGQTPWQINTGGGAESHPVVDRFHMVDAAHNLAKELAGRGASTLRRYQGRH